MGETLLLLLLVGATLNSHADDVTATAVLERLKRIWFAPGYFIHYCIAAAVPAGE